MQSQHNSSHRGQPMLVSSPRCALNCQQLKIHLPPLADSRDLQPDGHYLSPPMSASPVQSRFANAPQQFFNYHRKHSDSSKPGRSDSGKHSPAGSYVGLGSKARYHDQSLGLSTPPSSSGVGASGTSRASVQSINGISNLREESHDDSSSSPKDSPEGQHLTSGAPGVARRAKAHVPSACVNCKRKHLACETKRPCNRCVQSGKEASCVDVQHKKRGRPRLREEDNLREAAFANEYVRAEDYARPGSMTAVPSPGRPKSKNYRELRSQPGLANDQQPRTSNPAYGNGHYGQPISHAPLFISASVPTVLLTRDLVVAQHNHAFAQALAMTFNARGHGLLDLVVPSEREKIYRLQNALRSEMDDAARSRPGSARFDSWASIPAIENLDIGRATAGFETRSEYWTFRLSKEQSRGFPISISLAEAGAIFIVLTLIQRPDSASSVLSPGLSGAIGSHQLASSPSHAPRSPLLERNLSKTTQQQRTHNRTYSYGDPAPLMSPTASIPLELQPTHCLSVSQYSQRSPPKNTALPYIGSKHSSSPEQIRVPRSRDEITSIPAHLQLPPIRTSGSGLHESRGHDHRNGRSSGKASPVKGSPQNGRKKKRKRFDIEEMLR